MRLRPLAATLETIDCRTRLPFRFGISTLTRADLCIARLEAETDDGAQVRGWASDLLVPKWFEKDPATTLDEDTRRLRASATSAADLLCAAGADTAFGHWWRLHEALVAPGPPDASDRLRRGFGVALWERALIDAACRAAAEPFARAVRGPLLGFDGGRLHSELTGAALAAALPAQPRRTIAVRHTVGLVDVLRRRDIVDPVDDGLPESLEDDLRHGSLRWLKIKVNGDRGHDLDRLERIADVVADAATGPMRITLDGNEQYDTLDDLLVLLEDLRSSRAASLLAGLVAIEQPLARMRTFDADRNAAIGRVTAHAPLLIDEADASIDAFPRAIALGYRGVSVKNCKGVFRACANRMLCTTRDGLFQSAEDLTNLPVIALQQDLATVATLGLEHVERNGHHYFRGLDHLAPETVAAALSDHGDLYEPFDGGARLRVRDGMIDTGSVVDAAGYGHLGARP